MAAKRKPNYKRSIERDELLSAFIQIGAPDLMLYVIRGAALNLILDRTITQYEIALFGNPEKFTARLKELYHEMIVCSYDGDFLIHCNEQYRILVRVNNAENKNAVIGRLSSTIQENAISALSFAISLHPDSLGKLIDPLNNYPSAIENGIQTRMNSQQFNSPAHIMYYAWLISEFALDPDQEFIKEVSASSVNFRAMSPAMRTYFLFAILAGQRPSRGLIFLLQSGLMKDVFRSLQYLAGVDQRNAHGHKDIFYHTCEVVDNVARAAQNVWLRFSALVHDIAKPKTKKYSEETGWSFHGHEELGARWMDRIFQQLELPPWKLDYVKKMIRLHLRPSALASEEVTDSAIRRLQTEAGGDLQDLMILCRADITSKNYSKVSRFLKNYDYVEERLLDVRQKDELAAFQSPVRGEEIMRICGLKPSRAVGILKETIEEAILSGHIPNTYEAALEYLYQIKDKILADIRIKL